MSNVFDTSWEPAAVSVSVLKKLGCTPSESFFVNGVEIDAHENKNTIGANLSPFMADLVDSGV